MKKHTILQPILLLFLSLSLFNCYTTNQSGKSDKSTATPRPDEETLIKSIKSDELKTIMSNLRAGSRLEDSDFLLLVLDEGTDEEKQIKILNFFIARAGIKNISQEDIYPVLVKAIQQKKNNIVKFLLNRFKINHKGLTLLHRAVAMAPKETVEALLFQDQKGEIVNANSPDHGTALHYLLEVPFELDGKRTNDIPTRKAILELLLHNAIIKLETKNRNKHTAVELAKMLANQNEEAARTADQSSKQIHIDRQNFYNFAAQEIEKAIAERKKH